MPMELSSKDQARIKAEFEVAMPKNYRARIMSDGDNASEHLEFIEEVLEVVERHSDFAHNKTMMGNMMTAFIVYFKGHLVKHKQAQKPECLGCLAVEE
ncbi:hypothetical protein LCGC14_1297230 [marine sediment metagenome]|uniref:Uncharacterized protein n=1 Tax=marine sediment metagenome TaxID=412755 RepID=A0A0F9NTK1_9ZZZZ